LLCRSGYDKKTKQDATHTLQQVKEAENQNSI